MTEENNQKEQVLCNECKHRTWHKVIASHVLTCSTYDGLGGDDYEGEVDSKWDLLQCMGCGAPCVRLTIEIEGFEDPYMEFYPTRTIDHHAKKHYVHLPDKLTRLYYEVINTYNQKNLLLCSAGLRALLEGICVDKEITEGPNEKGKVTKSLEGRINGLTSIVPVGIVKNLHGLRFLGNRGLHDLDVPNESGVRLAITVIEDIMNVIYELDYNAQLLMKSTQSKKGTTIPPNMNS
jgi:uncharacterized protein DUF4145